MRVSITPRIVKLKQLVDVSQGLVLHPMPGFVVPITNISPGMPHPSICALISRKNLMQLHKIKV